MDTQIYVPNLFNVVCCTNRSGVRPESLLAQIIKIVLCTLAGSYISRQLFHWFSLDYPEDSEKNNQKTCVLPVILTHFLYLSLHQEQLHQSRFDYFGGWVMTHIMGPWQDGLWLARASAYNYCVFQNFFSNRDERVDSVQ